MTDDMIISSMVKGRECCRKLVQAYESARLNSQTTTPSERSGVGTLATADRAVTRMLVHLRDLPQDPKASMAQPENAEYAVRLLREIRDLLEKAMMLEREMREAMPRVRSTTLAPPPRVPKQGVNYGGVVLQAA